jgi:hypothetical protein
MLITLSLIKSIYQDYVTTFKIDIFRAMNHINYVNSVMHEINEMTDNIYESLVDEDSGELKYNIQRMIKILKDIDKSHGEDKDL